MKTPANIIDGAHNYIFIIFIGIPTVFLYNIVAGVIRATGDSKTPVVFLVLSSIINIVLDLYFIISLHMGVAGSLGNGDLPGSLRCGMSGLYGEKIRDPADSQGRMESGRAYDDGAVRHGRSDWTAVFHYRHWQRYLTDYSRQYIRLCGSCGYDRRRQDRQLLSLSF